MKKLFIILNLILLSMSCLAVENSFFTGKWAGKGIIKDQYGKTVLCELSVIRLDYSPEKMIVYPYNIKCGSYEEHSNLYTAIFNEGNVFFEDHGKVGTIKNGRIEAKINYEFLDLTEIISATLINQDTLIYIRSFESLIYAEKTTVTLVLERF